MRNLLTPIILILFAIPTFSATKTWDGGGADANWQTAANWSTDIAPVAGDDLVFPTVSAQQTTNNNFFILTSFRSILVEGGTYVFGGNPIRLTNGLTVSSGTQTFNLAMTLSGAQSFLAGTGGTATLLILSVGTSPLTIDGSGIVGIGLISGSGPVTKNGQGIAAIIAASGFSGGITLNDGIFVVDANIPNSPVTVQSAAPIGTLALTGFGGTGTVGTTNVTSGVISAGTLTSPTGVLNLSAGLTLTANGAYACKIGGTSPGTNGHDQLNVTGTVNLGNSRLAPIPWAGFRPAVGDTFLIIKNDGVDAVNGTFLDYPEGAVFSGPLNSAFQISYVGGDGNDVTIKRVARAQFDFDGDGKSDVSTFNPQNAVWDIKNSGSSPTSTGFGLTTDRIVPADFDGDNKTDLAVFRDGVWWIANSRTVTVTSTQFGSSGDIPVPNDFDGDGRADLAIFRPSNGTWYQLRSLGNQTVIQQFGASGDIPLLADYDGDGIGDLALYRPTGGEWHFFLSATNSYTAFPFGIATDKPVPGDYDGDGKTDVAVFRGTSDSNLPDFYVLLTANSAYTGYSWGVPGDQPVVGDYDGDGRSDIGVFRAASFDWYLLRSTAGFQSVVWGSGNAKAVPSAFVP